MSKPVSRIRFFACVALAASFAVTATGCSVSDAVVDGAFAGVSNTVATIVSDALLAAISVP